MFLKKCVTTLALGSQPKQKGLARFQAKRKLECHTTCSLECGKCEGKNPHIPKATLTLGDVVPMDSQIFKRRLQGSKLNDLRSSIYHRKVLGTYMSEMARMTHLDI